jgi:hypothetical protein
MATQDITPKVDNPSIIATPAISPPAATGVTAPARPGLSIAELIHEAETNPPQPILEGLIHENEIVGLHGSQEAFKTMWCLQLAEALATGGYFLGQWKAARPMNVFFLETEMSVTAMGKRARQMYGKSVPMGVFFATERELKQFRRAPDLAAKMNMLDGWLSRYRASGIVIDVVIVDTANPLFRGRQSPNDETTAGEFFDRLANLPGKLKVYVRHNRKRRADNGGVDVDEDAQSQRGSGQFADVPDLLMQMKRSDKRVDCADLEITKFRHGSKPAEFVLCFDRVDYRLIPYPKLVHLLREDTRSRDELIAGLKTHFSMGHNAAETNLKTAKVSGLIVETPRGHQKLFGVNWEKARRPPDEGDYWYERYERIWGVGYKKQEDSNLTGSCTVPQAGKTKSDTNSRSDNNLEGTGEDARPDQDQSARTSSNVAGASGSTFNPSIDKPFDFEGAMRRAEERAKRNQAETEQKLKNMVSSWNVGEKHYFLNIQAQAEKFGLTAASTPLTDNLHWAVKNGLLKQNGTLYWRTGDDK